MKNIAKITILKVHRFTEGTSKIRGSKSWKWKIIVYRYTRHPNFSTRFLTFHALKWPKTVISHFWSLTLVPLRPRTSKKRVKNDAFYHFFWQLFFCDHFHCFMLWYEVFLVVSKSLSIWIMGINALMMRIEFGLWLWATFLAGNIEQNELYFINESISNPLWNG